jgi:hypothetical protein
VAKQQRPLRRRLQARFMRMLNVPMRWLLVLPVATPLSGRLMLLNYRGRRTGKQYRQPLSYVRHDDTLLTPGGGTWTLSLVAGRPQSVRLGGHDVMLSPELVGSLDEVQRLIQIMAETNPAVRRFIGIPQRPDGRLDGARLQTAIDHGFRIVRWHPEPAARPRAAESG